MKKDIAKKWIKALRSGKYKQGQSFLKYYNNKNEPRHCCLGVLCELYNETMKKNHKKILEVKTCNDEYSIKNGYVRFNGKEGGLPTAVKKWAGMKNELGLFEYIETDRYGSFSSQEDLATLNDNGTKFPTIAKIIEKNIENL